MRTVFCLLLSMGCQQNAWHMEGMDYTFIFYECNTIIQETVLQGRKLALPKRGVNKGL